MKTLTHKDLKLRQLAKFRGDPNEYLIEKVNSLHNSVWALRVNSMKKKLYPIGEITHLDRKKV